MSALNPLGGMPGQIWGFLGRSEIRPVYISTQDISIRLAKLLHVPRLLAHSPEKKHKPSLCLLSLRALAPPSCFSLSPLHCLQSQVKVQLQQRVGGEKKRIPYSECIVVNAVRTHLKRKNVGSRTRSYS